MMNGLNNLKVNSIYLDEIRKSKGMTLETLSKGTGISISTLSTILSGGSCSLHRYYKLCDFLRVEITFTLVSTRSGKSED